MAKLYFKYGAMGSSKTAQALIRNALHGQQILERLICTPAAKR